MMRTLWKVLVWLFSKLKPKPKASLFGMKIAINDDLPEGWFELCTGKEMVATDGVYMIHCKGENKEDAKVEITKAGVTICGDMSMGQFKQWIDGLKIKHKEARK